MKELRLRRLFGTGEFKKIIITPLDHGMTMGPIPGLYDAKETIAKISNTSTNAIVLHKGLMSCCSEVLCENKELAVIMHLSASIGFSPNSERKVLVSSVEEAVMMGADAVSVHVNLGSDYDYQMIKDFGHVSSECHKWGMPLLAMVYARGKNINEFDADLNMVGARVAMEMGADVVKVNYINDKEKFHKLVNSVNIPVVVAGNCLECDVRYFYNRIGDAMESGAAGVAVGRNVFQREDMGSVMNAIDMIVNHGSAVDEVMETLN